MRLKKGVKAGGIKPEILLALVIADTCWKRFGDELVITSICDGKHKEGSKHYIGQGADLRTRNFHKTMIPIVATDLQDRLGSDYDVIVESDHIHIEFDPS